MAKLDDDDLEELRETFEYNDLDGDGRIELGEFMQMLENLGAETTIEEAEIGFGDVDSDNDGLIDFAEFAAWWSEQ
jgi:Ca2+-binding EF-hand superfamily protein